VIQEFKVQTSLYDASQAAMAAATSMRLLKSGTEKKKFHGDAYEYFRNDILQRE